MTPGRRLRLDRRKAGLDQDGLARLLGVDKETVSKMERDLVPLTDKARAFSASPPVKVPGPAKAKAPQPGAAETAPDEPLPEPEPEPGEPGPRVEHSDSPPRPGPRPKVLPALPSAGEIAELEAALLKMFAGESFLIPRPGPDGEVIQVEAVIPGIAQAVGMFDEFDGMVIRTYAPGMAKAWAELARQNATVRKVLMGLTYGGAYRGVIAATLPPVLAIMAHHGMVPQLGAGSAPAPGHPPADGSGTQPPTPTGAPLAEVDLNG